MKKHGFHGFKRISRIESTMLKFAHCLMYKKVEEL
jgi:hypothetical protein